MPRKAKVITKEESQKIKEKKSMSQEEANTLEQMLDKDDDQTDISEIKDSLPREPRRERTSPSLNKVNAPQRVPTRLEGSLAEAPVTNTSGGDDDDPFKYTAGQKKSGEAKYIQYDGAITENTISRREIESLDRRNQFEKRAVGFESSIQSRTPEQMTVEKYNPVNKFDKDKQGKEKQPFEKKEIKYTPSGY